MQFYGNWLPFKNLWDMVDFLFSCFFSIEI